MADKLEAVQVVAVERGHDGRRVIEAGEQFTVPAARLKDGSNWFVRADAFQPKPVDPRARPPGAGPAKGSAAAADDGVVVPGANPHNASSLA